MANPVHLDSMVAPGDPAVHVSPSYHTSSGRHDHDFYELVYVTEGYCLHSVEDLSTLLTEGDIFILRPGVRHKYSGNRITRIYNCVFGESAVDAYVEELRGLPGMDLLFRQESAPNPPLLHLTLSERKLFLRLITSMYEECKAHPLGWRIRLRNQLASLLVEYSRALCAHGDSGKGDNAYPAYVRQALSVIDAQYSDCDLSVHRIAAQVGVSDDYLSRQFRQVTGISTQEYLRRYRFARAMGLLQANCSIGDTAMQVGFRSLSYFSREFTQELGITPSRYKKQND